MVTVATGDSAKLIHTETFESVTDLSEKQFYFVKLSSDRRIALSNGQANYSVGVLLDNPSGTSASPKEGLVLVSGRCKVIAGGNLAAGNQIKVDSSGRAIVAATGTAEFIVGVVIEAVGTITAGESVECLINCQNAQLTAAA